MGFDPRKVQILLPIVIPEIFALRRRSSGTINSRLEARHWRICNMTQDVAGTNYQLLPNDPRSHKGD